MQQTVRSAFFGTPEIAVPALEALAEISQLVGVVCQPDRPSGRGLKLTAPAVKLAAERLGCELLQPLKVRTGSLQEWLKAREVEVVVVLAYGRILPAPVLSAPRFGCINLHASILPKYRGAAPINWALINGETETGISLMQMDEGLDTGPVYAVERLPIPPTANAGSLSEALAEAAARMVRGTLPRVLAGELRAVPQNEAEATLAPPLQKRDTVVDFGAPAQTVINRVRGLTPRPGAHTTLKQRRLKLLEVAPSPVEYDGPIGRVLLCSPNGIVVGTAHGAIDIRRAQLEGRGARSARDLCNGRTLVEGDQLGT